MPLTLTDELDSESIADALDPLVGIIVLLRDRIGAKHKEASLRMDRMSSEELEIANKFDELCLRVERLMDQVHDAGNVVQSEISSRSALAAETKQSLAQLNEMIVYLSNDCQDRHLGLVERLKVLEAADTDRTSDNRVIQDAHKLARIANAHSIAVERVVYRSFWGRIKWLFAGK